MRILIIDCTSTFIQLQIDSYNPDYYFTTQKYLDKYNLARPENPQRKLLQQLPQHHAGECSNPTSYADHILSHEVDKDHAKNFAASKTKSMQDH